MTADTFPNNQQWLVFLQRLLLLTGLLFLSAAITFFIAANWQALGRFSKLFGLEALLCLSVAGFVLLQHKYPQLARALLAFSSLLLGVLLAFVGQTYQTGADPWQLFALWALLMIPWTMLVNHWGLWLWWVLLVDIAIVLYGENSGRSMGWISANSPVQWALLAWQASCLLLAELLSKRFALALRAGLMVVGWLFCSLLILQVITGLIDSQAGPIVTAMLLATIYAGFYRYHRLDGKMLASVALFYLLSFTLLLGRVVLEFFLVGGFFMLTVFLIVGSTYTVKYFKALPKASPHE